MNKHGLVTILGRFGVGCLLLLPGCGGSEMKDPEGLEDSVTPEPTTSSTTPAPSSTVPNPKPTATNTPPAPTGTGTAEPPPPIAGSRKLTIKTDFFDIPPGGESFKCQSFANPFGQDVDIVVSESRMQNGSHHMFVFKEPGAVDGPVTDCSGLEFKQFIHSSQTPVQRATYPKGVGRFLPGTEGLRFMAHYLNPTDETIHAQVVLDLEYVDPTQVTAHAAEIFLNKLGVFVGPGKGSESASYTVPFDIKLLAGVSHMHKRGVHFLANTSDGKTLFEGSEWDEPAPKEFPEGLDIAANTKITFTCDYENDTGRTLTFGESADVNEMCIFSGVYYPAPNGAGLSAQIFR